MVAEVGLEAEALDNRQEGLHKEDGGSRPRHIRCHMASPLTQHSVDSRDAIYTHPTSKKPSSFNSLPGESSTTNVTDRFLTDKLYVVSKGPGVHNNDEDEMAVKIH